MVISWLTVKPEKQHFTKLLHYRHLWSGQVPWNRKNLIKAWLQSEDGWLIIPENAQWKILKGLHQSFHLGVESTYQIASSLFEGKNVMKTLKNIINRCEVCQKNNPKTEKLAKSGLQRRGKYPGEDWEIDFTHMPKANGYSCLLVCVDLLLDGLRLFPAIVNRLRRL